jgi:putative ABC transport system permease protein
MKYLPLVLRNVFRNKIRSIFTGLSIAISLFPMVLLYSFLDLQDDMAASNAQYNRVAVLHEGGLAGQLPIAYLDRIRRQPGVKEAIPLSWFGGNYREEKIQFAQFATDPKAFFEVYPEYACPPDQVAAWQNDKTGCLVGSVIAENKGWKIGDKIPLQGNIYPVDLELTVRGIYDGPDTADRSWLVFHFDYFDESLKEARAPNAGNAGIIMLTAESAAKMAPVMQNLESAFASSDAPVKPMTEKEFGASFLEMMGNVRGFIRMTSTAIVIALICVAGNTMAMAVRERTREIALFKAIGFNQNTVLGMFLAESIVIGLIGGVLGCIGTKFLFASIDLSSIDPGLGMFYVPWRTALWGVVLAAAIGLFSGLIPAWRAAHVSVIEGLRKVV